MSLPLWVLPSEKTSTPSSRIARMMAVVVTARPSGVVLKYVCRPSEVKRAALDGDDALRTSPSRQSTRRAARRRGGGDGRDVRHVLLVGLGEVGGVGVDVEPLARHPRHGVRVSRPPEKAMPIRWPIGSWLRIFDMAAS